MIKKWVVSVLLLLLSGMGQEIRAEGGLMSVETLVQANSAFAFDLYAQLRNSGGNLFLSPYSVSAAMAMAYAGARGNTQEQMGKTLRFPAPQQGLHQAFEKLGGRLRKLNEESAIKLFVANSLWPQRDYGFLEEYLSLIRKHYGVSITPVDYRNASEAAREMINKWVEGKTEHKIKELLPPGVLDALTRLVIVNAIYFKGEWASKFEAGRTKDEPFFVSPGVCVQAPLMRQDEEFRYCELDSVQILEMPYLGKGLSMFVLLPRDRDGLVHLERRLSVENLELWRGALQERDVQVFLPRFNITSTFRLDKALCAMGMVDAFGSSEADFSGMDGKTEWLYIGAVLHKGRIEVKEEGSEAAAATAIMGPAAAPPGLPPVVFRADHPFFFMIQDNRSGSLLFLGRVTDPTSTGE